MGGRREQILATAATLFAERGFHGVSVADIGAACAMSGPALYKHFTSKDALLAEMLVSVSRRLLDGGRARAGAATDPADACRRLIEGHVEFALTQPALIVVQDRDWAQLPPDARAQVRSLQRDYIGVWADQLRRLDPAPDPPLDAATARARAQAVFGLINSTPHSARLPEVVMRAELERMAARALGVPDAAGAADDAATVSGRSRRRSARG